jgi:EmrB/QacA subfamily drug resistance transporter
MVNRFPILAVILVSYLMIVIDISIVITGLPAIQAELGFSTADLSWVQNAYMLAFGGLLLLGARAGDIFGRRLMFVLGLGLFTAASLAIGLAQSPTWLIATRVVQGVGAAVLAPSTLALLQTNFPEGPKRTRAVAYYAAAAGVGASLGLVMGGILADTISWRAGFFVNVPIGIALIVATRRVIRETPHAPGKLDLAGALLSTLGMTALVFGFVRSASQGWGDTLTLGSIGCGVLLLALFAVNERRALQPIMPLRLFGDRERVGAYTARLLFMGGMASFWFFATQLLQGVMGYSPLVTGFAFLATTLPNFFSAMAVPRLTQRFGNPRLLAGGLVLGVIGMFWLSRAGSGADFWMDIALPMALIGIGQGGVLGPMTSSGIARVTPGDAGAASGLVNVTHQLGGSLGLAILVAVFSAVDTGNGNVGLAQGIDAALVGASVMLLLSTVLVLALVVRTGRPRATLTPRNLHNLRGKS